MNPKRLFLIDGMSHIYRAYYAIRNLSNAKGLPTNAVFGFISMLRKLIQEQKPEYIGVALDLEGPTVRHEKYQAYKATRKPMPEDLILQIPYILRACKAFCVPVISHAGYEADDVIGTLSLKATQQGPGFRYRDQRQGYAAAGVGSRSSPRYCKGYLAGCPEGRRENGR